MVVVVVDVVLVVVAPDARVDVVVVVPDEGPGPLLNSSITLEPLGTATGFELLR